MRRALLASLLLFVPLAARAEPLERLAGSRLMLEARVDGHPVRALLDSAAEMTLLDRGYAQRIGLGGGARVTGRGSGKASFEAGIVPRVRLSALGVDLPPGPVAVTDLSEVGQRLLGRPLDAILGRELFDAARLEIDVARATIRVLPEGEAPRGRRLALVAEHGVETVPVAVEGHTPVRATFDLGNGERVLLSRRYAQRLGVLRDGRAVQRVRGGGLGGEAEREAFTLRSLAIAGHVLHDVAAAIDPQDNASELNVGLAVLGRYVIVTDYAHRAVWLADPAPPRGRAGSRVE